MKKIYAFIPALLIVLATTITASAGAKHISGAPAPDFTATDIDGKTIKLSDFRGKVVVLEWTNSGCPFVERHYHWENMQMLQKQYTDEGVIWISICSSAKGKQGYESNELLKKRIEVINAFPSYFIRDDKGTLGRLYGAKTTPHMFVINKDGILAYQGAIDNKPSKNKDDDPNNARSYIREAIQSCMNGEAPEKDETPPYGCSVKY